ncbi:unnamed protein product [Discula destructiva]
MATTEVTNAAVAPAVAQNGAQQETDYKLRFATVCASNQNRSMEGHLRLAQAGYPVISFGTGSLVRLPGPTITQPNVYQFNKTSYDSMYKELESKDPRLYRANGLLNMLGRNRGIKWGPERWQDWQIGVPRLGRDADQGHEGTETGVVDVVITCEERCWDNVVDDLLARGSPLNRPVHVINVDIKDNHEEASVGGRGIVDLADSLNRVAMEEREAIGHAAFDGGSAAARSGFDERVPDVLAEWQERWPNLPATWTLSWF